MLGSRTSTSKFVLGCTKEYRVDKKNNRVHRASVQQQWTQRMAPHTSSLHVVESAHTTLLFGITAWTKTDPPQNNNQVSLESPHSLSVPAHAAKPLYKVHIKEDKKKLYKYIGVSVQGLCGGKVKN